MGKLGLIIKREYLAKVRNKSFILMTILSPLLLVTMVVLIAYLAKINDTEKKVVAILNTSAFFHQSFQSAEGISYVHLKDLTLEKAKDSTHTLGYYGLLYLPEGTDLEAVAQSAHLYVKGNPNIQMIRYLESTFQKQLRQDRLQKLGISQEQFSRVEEAFEISLSTFDGQKGIKGINELKAFIGGGFGYIIMMFIVIYGGFVMRSVIEEKTSRIIELIISSVKPFQLMLGKIVGTSLAGVTQFVLWIIFAALLLVLVLFFVDIDLNTLAGETPSVFPSTIEETSQLSTVLSGEIAPYVKEILNIPWILLLTFFLLYFVLGYLIYSSMYAAIGAAVDNETDTQQFIFPIILPLMLALYVGFLSVFSNPHGPIAVGFSLFPLTAPIVMMMRLPGGIGEGGVPLWQLLLSLGLLLVAFVGIVVLASKIYRVGILMYGKKATYKELIKWLKF